MTKKLILCGNPNTGKTTIFNMLTKSNERVGNWHGVTQENITKKLYYENLKYEITDLPGIYSLTPFTLEEKTAIDFLVKCDKDSLILNVCDEQNLRRNLYLTMCLKELNYKIVLLINRMDRKQNFSNIEIEKLSKKLEIPIILVDYKTKRKTIFEKLKTIYFTNKSVNYFDKLPLKDVMIEYDLNDDNLFVNYYKAIQILENNLDILSKLNIKENRYSNFEDVVIKLRYDEINKVFDKAKNDFNYYGYSKVDKILLNKYLAIPIFLLIMFLIFYITFSTIGKGISYYFSNFLVSIIDKLEIMFIANNFSTFITRFFCEGVLCGLGVLLTFLPQIILLYLFLGMLEHSGYLSRLSFIFDDFLSKYGLNGKCIFTLLLSLGCSSQACLTCSSVEDENTKIKLAIITPYVSCSAKIPLFLVVGGAFFGQGNIFLIIFLYLLGIALGFISLLFYNKIIKRNNETFLFEMSKLKFPKLKVLTKNLIYQTLEIITRIGSLLIVFNALIWIIQNCNFSLMLVDNIEDSILSKLGKFLAPIFIPLGFGNYAIVASLICGILAKEVIVSTIAMYNGVSTANLIQSIQNQMCLINFNPISAISFLVFSLLYMPCISTISILITQIGKKWTRIALLIQFLLSYAVTFMIYTILLLLKQNVLVTIILIFMFILLTIITINLLKKWQKMKNKVNLY